MKLNISVITRVFLGDLNFFSVNHRIFNALSIFFFVFSTFITLFSINKLHALEVLITVLFTVGYGSLYLTSRFLIKRRFWLFVVVTELFITYLLYISNGFNANGAFLFLIAYAAFRSISEKQNEWLIFGIIALHFTTLLLINFYFPELVSIRSHSEASMKWHYFIITTVSVGFIINSLKLNFTHNTELLEKQKEESDKLFESVNKSIAYASNIQNALYPEASKISSLLPEHFILFLPRDIVSGDFYWINEVDNKIILAVGDCTGHGIPGAFMSMLGISLLNEIVLVKKILSPNEILKELRTKIKMNIPNMYDGMDVALVSINLIDKKIAYSGANSPIYLIRNENLIEYKADRQPVGLYSRELDFTLHEIDFEPNDTFYMFSDGYSDQMNVFYKKFLKKRFKELLLKINTYPLSEQKHILETNFEYWKDSSSTNKNLTHSEIEKIFFSLNLFDLLTEKSKLQLLNTIILQKNKTIGAVVSSLKEQIPDLNEEIVIKQIQKINQQTDDVVVMGFRL
jgi:serine phosphatase RsbU (regulator of sigma subunit)